MFKTLVGASIAALLFSSVSIANVPGVEEAEATSTQEMSSPLYLLVSGDVLPTESNLILADALPTETNMILANAQDTDVLPTETNMRLFLIMANVQEAEVTPADVG